MQSVYDPLSAITTSQFWLVTASIIFAAVMYLWMMRYRTLYRDACREQANTNELIENLSEGIYRSTPEGKQLNSNRALVKLNGYETKAEMLEGVKNIATEWYVDPTRRDKFRSILKRDGKIRDFVSEVYRHKTRERIWITESARLVCDEKTGKPLYYEGSVREITETMKRLKLEEQFSRLTREVPGALFQIVMHNGAATEVAYLSPGFERVTGIANGDMIADPQIFMQHVHAEDRNPLRRCVAQSLQEMEPWEHELRFLAANGVEKWLRLTATPEIGEGMVAWHGYMADLSVRKQNEMAVEKLAYYDPLTGLPNRRLFLDRMRKSLTNCRDRGDRGALLFIDLDNFKELNDTQGHDMGDQYLVQVSERLRRCVAEKDTVARIGGDEFVVIVESIGEDDAIGTMRAVSVGNRIVGTLREPFQLGTLSYRATASVGVVVFDGREAEGTELLKRADIAMYQAKSSGRDSIALFDPVSMASEAERFRLAADLRAAMAGRDEIDLHYQPVFDHNGQFVGAEGLARWDHPDDGLLLPAKFIPMAERYGLISELGNILMAKGLASLSAWQNDPRTAGIRLGLNVSVQQFYGEDFVSFLKDRIASHGIDPQLLTLEVTEHVMAKDKSLIARRMRELKELGIRLSLDNFGSGHCSLAYLKELPFDEVKIDGGFVADIETAESDRALVRTILAMSRMLGLNAVAEHVENVKQEAFLRAYGCNNLQGFYYSPALPFDEFKAYALSRYSNPDVIAFPDARQKA